MAGRTRKTVGSGRVERVVKQGPRASVVRGGKGQAGSTANRKGKAAKNEVPWDQEAVGVDILKAERGKAAKTRKNRQKPAAEAATAHSLQLGRLEDLILSVQEGKEDEVDKACDLLDAFVDRWRRENELWTHLRVIIEGVKNNA